MNKRRNRSLSELQGTKTSTMHRKGSREQKLPVKQSPLIHFASVARNFVRVWSSRVSTKDEKINFLSILRVGNSFSYFSLSTIWYVFRTECEENNCQKQRVSFPTGKIHFVLKSKNRILTLQRIIYYVCVCVCKLSRIKLLILWSYNLKYSISYFIAVQVLKFRLIKATDCNYVY